MLVALDKGRVIVGETDTNDLFTYTDTDGDGVADLAVGSYRDNTGASDAGAVYVLLLNATGTVKSTSTSGPARPAIDAAARFSEDANTRAQIARRAPAP